VDWVMCTVLGLWLDKEKRTMNFDVQLWHIKSDSNNIIVFLRKVMYASSALSIYVYTPC